MCPGVAITLKLIPRVNEPLEFEDGQAYLRKTDILKELMYFSYDKTSDANLYPYLMFEDFRGIDSFNNGDKHSNSNIGSKAPYYIPSGWSFARAGGAAGKAVRLAAHRELFANYPSRCDSPVLNCIKEGKSVDLVFSFDYSMDRQEGAAITNPKLGINVFVGWTDKTGDLGSGDTDGTYADSFELNETGGSYDLIDKTYTVVLPNMTSQKFASDSGSRLGKIKTASQGVFSIENRDSNTPNIKKVRVVTSVTYYLKN